MLNGNITNDAGHRVITEEQAELSKVGASITKGEILGSGLNSLSKAKGGYNYFLGKLKGGTKAEVEITNDVLGKPRVGGGVKGEGSGAKIDDVSPIKGFDTKGREYIVKEFPATPQAHGFTDIVDNYAGSATQFDLGKGANLYQIEGSLNGTAGRFEWITQNCNITHRMFVSGGAVNGVPIR